MTFIYIHVHTGMNNMINGLEEWGVNLQHIL